MSAVSISYSHVSWANYRNHLLGLCSQVNRYRSECRSLSLRVDRGELALAHNWSGSAGINFHPHWDLIDCYINYNWSVGALCSNKENFKKFLTWLSAAGCAMWPIVRCIRVNPNVISRRQVLRLGSRTTTLQGGEWDCDHTLCRALVLPKQSPWLLGTILGGSHDSLNHAPVHPCMHAS